MSWAAVCCAAASALASAYANKKALESATGIHTVRLGSMTPHKCPCCGARETRWRGKVRICAYCRSEV
jgi:hypothetical protein